MVHALQGGLPPVDVVGRGDAISDHGLPGDPRGRAEAYRYGHDRPGSAMLHQLQSGSLQQRSKTQADLRIVAAVAVEGRVAVHEVDGVRLLSPQTIDRIFEVQSNGIDLVLGMPSKWGLGYVLLPEGRVCFGGGTGGSTVVIDVDRRITFAYVLNKMAPGGGAPIAAALAERVKDIVTR